MPEITKRNIRFGGVRPPQNVEREWLGLDFNTKDIILIKIDKSTKHIVVISNDIPEYQGNTHSWIYLTEENIAREILSKIYQLFREAITQNNYDNFDWPIWVEIEFTSNELPGLDGGLLSNHGRNQRQGRIQRIRIGAIIMKARDGLLIAFNHGPLASRI